jgi:riboflavin kinase/FMN adenylyltransferase
VSEVFIYDFDREIYNKELTIILFDRIRGEEKFSSAEELVKQMDKDKETGIKIFSIHNN